MDEQRKNELLAMLVNMLEEECGQSVREIVDEDNPWLQFRALVNVREPWPASNAFLALQDELLQGHIHEAGIHTINDAQAFPIDARLHLWRGDITTLAIDAIVSTSVFGFPNIDAAEIALATVRTWLNEHESDINVVFNVYGEKDEHIYQNLLRL